MNRRGALLLMETGKRHGEQLAEGRYKIIGIIGQGGMGTVYAAEDRRLPGKEWAIKEIRSSGTQAEALVSEAAMLVKLSHPNLPQVVDYFASEDGVCGYLVMERIDGETLEKKFERSGKAMPVRDVLRYAIQICDALIYLHGTKPSPTIHRDLKPSNLLIDEHDRIVLIDFGTARTYKTGRAQDTVRLGTLGFAAPEQLADEQTDPRTDLYALGCILYYLLSGGRYRLSAAEPIGEALISCPSDLNSLIEKLLQANKDERYASALQVKSELSDILDRIRANRSAEAEPTGMLRVNRVTPQRIIAILSLYAGAGSTLVGLAIASLLQRAAIDHSYLEHPAGRLILPSWVKAASSDYTTWLPDSEWKHTQHDWSAESQLRLLFEQRNTIMLADLSDCWESDTVSELIQLADDLIVVTGPRRFQIESELCQNRLWQLEALAERGKHVHLFLNNCDSLPVADRIDVAATSYVRLPYCAALRDYEWQERPDNLLQDKRYDSWSKPIDHWLSQRLRDWGFLVQVGDAKRRGWFR